MWEIVRQTSAAGSALRWSLWSTGARTPSHRRRLGFGNNRHFKDVWLMNSILVDRIREQEMVARD